MKLRTALFALSALCAATGAEAGQRLFGFELEKTFSGFTSTASTMTARSSARPISRTARSATTTSNGADSGQWSVEGDTFCTFYESAQGACFFVERDGENCFTFYEAVEGAGGALSPSETWTSRGWNRESDSTCTTPPGAEI